jgi:hypothetical protein
MTGVTTGQKACVWLVATPATGFGGDTGRGFWGMADAQEAPPAKTLMHRAF